MRWFLQRSAAALLVLGFLSACGGGGSEPRAPSPTLPDPPSVRPPPLGPGELAPADRVRLREQVRQWAQTQAARLTGLSCPRGAEAPAGDPCERLQGLRFSQGQVSLSKLRADQTILLIDHGLRHAATLRYRSRMLAYYRVNPQTGLVEPHDPVLDPTPRWGAELLRAIDGFQFADTDDAGQPRQRPVFVPADWLSALHPVLKGERDFAVEARVAHGNPVLGQLVEASPQAGFVILDPMPFLAVLQAQRAAVCAKDATALQQGVGRTAASLAAVMQRHGVDYVNLSGGLDVEGMHDYWVQLGCPGGLSGAEAQTLVLAFRPLYSALFENPAVLGVQAAGVGMQPHSHPLDVLNLPQRVRVSLFQADHTVLPSDGVTGALRPAVREPLAQDRRWVDVFLNTGMVGADFPPGFTASPPLETDVVYGVNLSPMFDAGTSWSAPQALSRLIHLKRSLAPELPPEAPLNADLIRRLKSALTPQGCSWAPEDDGVCKLQDPAWHRQQELFRQGWLPADWRSAL